MRESIRLMTAVRPPRRILPFGRIASVFMVLLALLAAAAAAAKELPKNRRMAVVSFAANNTAPAVAGIVRNSVELNFFKDGGFDLLEQSQIDIILKERKMQMAACTDEICAAKLGELLQSDYIIIGSVDKLDKYTIHIKVVDVKSKKVIIAESQDADDNGALRPVTEKLTQTVARRIKDLDKPVGARKPMVITTEFRYVVPLGYLGSVMENGYGASLAARVEDLFVARLFAGGAIDFFYMKGQADVVHHAMMIPLAAQLGYALSFSDFFPGNKTLLRMRPTLVFRAAGGCSFIINNYYADRIYRYPTVQRRGLSPLLGAGIAIEFCLYGPLYFRGGVDYLALFEKGGVDSILTVSGGTSFRF